MNKEIKKFEYECLTNDYFHGKRGTRKRNDIIRLEFNDGTENFRIYINNSEQYVDVPKDNVMINSIAHITLTKDSTEQGNFIKSDADETNLKKILEQYNHDSNYTLCNIDDEVIDKNLKISKRNNFIANNPLANSENPF